MPRAIAVATGVALAFTFNLGVAQAAATGDPFTQALFAADQAAGKPIIVFIEASWCPTCAKERPIVASLMKDPAFKTLAVLDVDFDTQKPVVRELGADMQSTLIAFHGVDERGRLVGATKPAVLHSLFVKASS
jgi:thioredoxin 1